MKLTKPGSKIKPEFKVVESLKLDNKELINLRTLSTNVIVDLLESNIKRREKSLDINLKK